MDKKAHPTRFGLIIITLFVVVLAAGTVYAAEHGAAAGSTWWGLSTEKLWDFLWRTLNFAALVVILVKFLAKPIANGLKGRQLAIKEQFDTLEARKAEAEKSYQAVEAKLAQIDQEVKQIMEDAIARGVEEKDRIIAEANRAADDIKRQAEMAVQHEIAAIQLQLREEVANQAVMMAEELIKKNLQQDDQVKLIEDYLEKVGTVQ
jgi:F-type H+-transporting ATPase subunit b